MPSAEVCGAMEGAGYASEGLRRRGFDKAEPCVTIHLQAKWKWQDRKVSVAFIAPAFTVPKWRNWQTRMVQVHVLARVWGFESLLRHQTISIPRAMNNLHGEFSF